VNPGATENFMSLLSSVYGITRCGFPPTRTQYGRSSSYASESYKNPPSSTTSRRVLTDGA
jgi:hypothetical protein